MPAKIKALTLLTDDGSENYGEAKKWMVESDAPKINHLIAQLDISFSNSMIEAAHKQLKYGFLYHQSIKDFEELLIFLALAIEDYNNRPQHVLGGLTPMEVLKGKLVDRSAENNLLLQARQLRIAENQRMKCCATG